MRIVVASPPKSGNHWIKCLLAEIYDLRIIEGDEKARLTADTLPGILAAGGFPDGSILHIHNRCTGKLCDAIDAVPAYLVSIIRNPYDAFLSLYHWTQERSARELDKRQGRPRQALTGKSIDDPAVLEFLHDSYGGTIEQANGWLHGNRAHVIRYEDLHADPRAALKALLTTLPTTLDDRIDAAILECTADAMRQRSEKMQWHVRSAKVGESRDQLGEAHLAIFRQQHGDAIRSLGYPVR